MLTLKYLAVIKFLTKEGPSDIKHRLRACLFCWLVLWRLFNVLYSLSFALRPYDLFDGSNEVVIPRVIFPNKNELTLNFHKKLTMVIRKNRYYVGTARGVLLYTGDIPNNFKISKSGKACEVTAIAEGRNPDELILGYQNGCAYLYSTESNLFSTEINGLEGDESIIGIGCIDKSIILAKQDGVINVWNNKKNDYFSINLEEKASLDVMVCNQNRANILGTGGESNDFKLWDVESRQCVFKAKSLGHDELQLSIPTSVKGISFFPNENNLTACCTKEGHVLLYDDRAQRRPVVKFLEKGACYTTISTAYRNREVLVGTSKGYMQWLDLNAAKVLKTFTTFTGSITSIVCDPVEPYVATVSLDRHLRVHNMETKELIYKCYMKQNLTKLLVKPIIKDEEVHNKNPSPADVDQEYEDLFQDMEEIREEKKQQKRIANSSENSSTKKVKKKRGVNT